MKKLVLRRVCMVSSFQNALRVPYEGFYGEEFIGVLYYNPVMKMFIPESVELLKRDTKISI